MKLDWGNWIYGLFAGSLGGAANAVSGAIGVVAVDPKNFAVGSAHSFEVMGVIFGLTFLKDAGLFLAQHPLPDIKILRATETITHPNPENPLDTLTKTVQQTTTEVAK